MQERHTSDPHLSNQPYVIQPPVIYDASYLHLPGPKHLKLLVQPFKLQVRGVAGVAESTAPRNCRLHTSMNKLRRGMAVVRLSDLCYDDRNTTYSG